MVAIRIFTQEVPPVLFIIALIVLAAALAAVIYNHKAIVADMEKLDAVAGKVDAAVVDPAVQAAKPLVAQAAATVSADVAGSQPKAQ